MGLSPCHALCQPAGAGVSWLALLGAACGWYIAHKMRVELERLREENRKLLRDKVLLKHGFPLRDAAP